MTLKKNGYSIQIHLQTCYFITLQLSMLLRYIHKYSTTKHSNFKTSLKSVL